MLLGRSTKLLIASSTLSSSSSLLLTRLRARSFSKSLFEFDFDLWDSDGSDNPLTRRTHHKDKQPTGTSSPSSASTAAADMPSIRKDKSASTPSTSGKMSPPTAKAGVKLLNSLPAPPLDYRWVHTGSKLLELPTVPITSVDVTYKPFSADENKRIEAAWTGLGEDRQIEIAELWGKEDGEWAEKPKKSGAKDKEKREKEKLEKDKKAAKGIAAPGGKDTPGRPATPASGVPSDAEAPEEKEKSELYKSIVEQAQNDPERLDVVKGVPVAQDSLFEVDLETLSLHPVFWPQSGPRIPVLRGTWFMNDETKPCTWDLAEELENGYQHVKPWLPSYQDELSKALVIGPSGEEKLKYPLPARFGPGLGVVFEDDVRCRIITSGAFDYVSRYVWSSLGSKPGGTFLYRGFTAAATAVEVEKAKEQAKKDADKEAQKKKEGTANKSKPKNPATPALSPAREAKLMADKEPETATDAQDEDLVPDTLADIMKKVKSEFDAKKKAIEEANAPVIHASNDDEPCTDLVLVIHGIGQNLATQYESFSFIYASNQLRQVLRKQSLDPALSSVLRNRRIQILPVQWRANLQLETNSARQGAQYERDNVFTVADITIGKSIPYVREITNSVLLDIPLFMSDHKQAMIEAVCQQANRMYRLWVARNPEFEKNGRVHIIGHSLGSALAAEILSHQPTAVPPISQLPKQVISATEDRFLFNTNNLFLAGSPLGVFLQLQQAHVIARSGRARTMNAQPDEAHIFAGRFGCMSCDNLYNIFYPTDPVAYAINPAVDVAVAKERPPLPIPSVDKGVFSQLPSLPQLPQMPAMPSMPNVSKYLPAYFSTPGASSADKARRPAQKAQPETEVELELQGGEMCLVGTRGERRFAALNPRGGLDFALPSSSVNDYLDMITAHGNYWNDNNFGAFILNETFQNDLDDARTGLDVPKFPGSFE